jgi:hypothetical protein
MRRIRLPFRTSAPPVPPRAAALLLLLPLLAGCAGGGGGDDVEPAAPAAEPQRVENEAVGVAVVVPADSRFELESNEGDEIRLRFPGDREFEPGTVIYRAEAEQYFGVNLVEAVNQRKADLEGMAGGQFFGQVELGGPLGTAYSTRGRYTDEAGNEVEEVRIFTVHPAGNRLLHMTYRYPATPGQTEARMMDQAFEAFGYVEPLDAAGVGASEGGEGAAAGSAAGGGGEAAAEGSGG